MNYQSWVGKTNMIYVEKLEKEYNLKQLKIKYGWMKKDKLFIGRLKDCDHNITNFDLYLLCGLNLILVFDAEFLNLNRSYLP